METFANLPEPINEAITVVLSQIDSGLLASRAHDLHERYMNREKLPDNSFIQSASDILAYCALRAPATYAQIYSALLQIQELIPDWQPKTLLDLGCGPGTGMWAAQTIWPSIEKAKCIDQEKGFLNVGEQIRSLTQNSLNSTWSQQNLSDWIETNPDEKYDLIIVANVVNELPALTRERLLNQLRLRSNGVVLVLEPGTSIGYQLIQSLSQTISETETIIAPYIQSFVSSDSYWIHFPQKFKRPEFQRRIRQQMRESPLMASDWEETKYSYVAFGKIIPKQSIWARCIGPINKQKGFLMIPLLTRDGVIRLKVMKRHKLQYNLAKNLRWGEIVAHQEDIEYR